MNNNSLGGGNTSLSSGFDSDIPESLSIVREGYDYVFVPKFGPGYECPICLSVLREPRQTKCGHRFCRDCLSHWMSESSNRCPVDNESLTENEIFPDNCIKREILSCPIKCPNHLEGCTELTTITHVQKHLDRCPMSLLPCPLNCPCVMPRKDIEYHELNQCENRMVACHNCEDNMPACMLEMHKSNCPKVVVQCSHCNHEVLREGLNYHIKKECKNVVVLCPFHALGCNESVLRDIEGIHLSAEIPSHLKMLATSYNAMLEGFTTLAAGLRQINKHTGTTHSDEDSQNSIVEFCGYCDDRLGNLCSETLQRHQRNQSHRHSGNISVEEQSSAILGGSLGQRSTSNNGISVFSNENKNSNVENHDSYSSMPPSTRVSNEKRDSFTNTDNHHITMPKLPLSSSQSVPILYQRSVTTTSETSPDPANSADSILQPNIADFASSLRDLCTHQQHVIEKQQVIVTNLCTKLASAESRLKQLEGEGTVGLAQNTCGDFYWSITDFSMHRQKALREETSILHSPAFFSSPWGYKLCLRVNINGSFNSQGEHFVSLFIHFMQGNNDHLLNWPFVGQIILSIIDQNPISKERRHAVETLKARPDIAAFQKPTSARNHKGFGYTDFISLNVLDNGNFVRDDTLIIRAQVFPSTQ